MEATGFKQVTELFDDVIAYAKARLSFEKLDLAERLVSLVATLITLLIVSFVAIFALLVATIALGFWLGSLLDSTVIGFALATLVYLIIGGVLWVWRKPILIVPFINLFVRVLFNDKHLDADFKPRGSHERQ
jgi:Putative Actinobacterial Holin-X, holin superfamily III